MRTFTLVALMAMMVCCAQADWYCYECKDSTTGDDGDAAGESINCSDKDSEYFGEPKKCTSNTAKFADNTCYKSMTKDDKITRGCGCPTDDAGACLAAPWDDDKWDAKNRCKKDDADTKHCTCKIDSDHNYCNSAFSVQSSTVVMVAAGLLALVYNRA